MSHMYYASFIAIIAKIFSARQLYIALCKMLSVGMIY